MNDEMLKKLCHLNVRLTDVVIYKTVNTRLSLMFCNNCLGLNSVDCCMNEFEFRI